jgi:hypothetical protein
MAVPTPAVPIIRNDDGSISVLVYLGRTLFLNFIHAGLAYPPTGYKARFGMTDKYGNALLASATSLDGSITFSDASLLPPDAVLGAFTGTVIAVIVPDEATGAIVKAAGKLDCVLEDPAGHEIPVGVGDWVAWKQVTP